MELKGETVRFPEDGYKGNTSGISRRRCWKRSGKILTGTRGSSCSDDPAGPGRFRRGVLELVFGDRSAQSGQVERAMEFLRSKNAVAEKDGALWFKSQAEESEDEEAGKDRVLKNPTDATPISLRTSPTTRTNSIGASSTASTSGPRPSRIRAARGVVHVGIRDAGGFLEDPSLPARFPEARREKVPCPRVPGSS